MSYHPRNTCTLVTDEEEGLTEGVDCQTWDPDCGAEKPHGGFSGDGPPPGRGEENWPGTGYASPTWARLKGCVGTLGTSLLSPWCYLVASA